MNEPNKPIVILKDLGWAVARAVISTPSGPQSLRRVLSIGISAPPCAEEETYGPAEGIYLSGEQAFIGLREMCEEITTALAIQTMSKP